MSVLNILAAVFLPVVVLFGLLPPGFRLLGRLIGNNIRSKTQQRRELLQSRALEEDSKQKQQTQAQTSTLEEEEEWERVSPGTTTPPGQLFQNTIGPPDETFEGIIGFFHPFCNAGGGGERVLFAAIHATQQKYPKALCIVYTGDHDASKEQILTNVTNRFNIHLQASRVTFLYLSTREWVLASTWPHFTLLGQSLGSLALGWEAANLLVPDVIIDTMGYAFILALWAWLFPSLPRGAYVHYPTISTDMLSSLEDESSGRGVNAGTGKGWKGRAKKAYWVLFARLYGWVGGMVDVVMTNSSWTQAHISSLWTRSRSARSKKHPIQVVYPPCAVRELEQKIPVDATSEQHRSRSLLYIAQFRPEKQHTLIIDAFADFLKRWIAKDPQATPPKLVLVGSVRDDHDEKRVYALRLQANPIKEHVEFLINAKWDKILELLTNCSIGVNGMWNEHFGIGVVEYQAAGLISVVHKSGGPKEDIVVNIEGQPTGFHASTQHEFTTAFEEALALSPEGSLAMRQRARKSAARFSEEVFAEAWVKQLQTLVDMSCKQ